MFLSNQTGKIRARLIALSMTMALAIPQTVVPVGNAASDPSVNADEETSVGSESSALAEELKALVRANLTKNFDAQKDDQLDICHEVRINNADSALTIAAQNYEKKGGIKSAKYALYDINSDKNDEMIMRYNGKKKNTVRVYNYDDYDLSVGVMKECTGVSDIRKNPKKKQIVIVTVPGKNKKTITAYKISSGKLKTVTTYKKSGKTYKKGSKKITKKTFDKYYKSVKKLAKIKLGSIPKESYEYDIEDEIYISKDFNWRSDKDDVGKGYFIMTKGDETTPSKDKYLAYYYSYDLVGWNEYSAEPAIERIVFGPDVVNPKTGKTYQQEDWEEFHKDYFGNRFAPAFLTETTDENGTPVLDIEADGKIEDIKVEETESNVGNTSYNCKEYDIPYGDSRLRMMFAIDGALAGKIIQAAMYYPEISGSVDHEKWTFSYGSDAGDPMEVDKDIYDQVTGSGSLAESEIRTLKIGAASKEYEQTFKVGSVVRFLVNIGSSGQFYTIDDKGEELILTNELNRFGEDEKDISGVEEKLIEFEKKLNPPTGQLSYGDAAGDCLFWRKA